MADETETETETWISDGHRVTVTLEPELVSVRLVCPDEHEAGGCPLASFFDNYDPLELYDGDAVELGMPLPAPIVYSGWDGGCPSTWRFAEQSPDDPLFDTPKLDISLREGAL